MRAVTAGTALSGERCTIETIVDANLGLPAAHANVQRRAAGRDERTVAEIDIIGFGLGRPIARERELDTIADRPACPNSRCRSKPLDVENNEVGARWQRTPDPGSQKWSAPSSVGR